MATENGNGAPKAATTPYLPFKTFQSALDTLKHGTPNQIDRSVFPSTAGTMQNQIINAFRFFGLIEPSGKPTAELGKLVNSEHRQTELKGLLEKAYPSLFQLGLANASPASLDSTLRNSAQLTGETHEKAKSFFLQAAKYAGVTLSPYLMKVTRTSSPRKKRIVQGQDTIEPAGTDNGGARSQAPPPQLGSIKTIQLESGADLSLSTSADLFSMSSDDRKFVLEILDKLEEYEQGHPADDSEDSGEEVQP